MEFAQIFHLLVSLPGNNFTGKLRVSRDLERTLNNPPYVPQSAVSPSIPWYYPTISNLNVYEERYPCEEYMVLTHSMLPPTRCKLP